ncbi:MAG TPA: hypothetical protein DEA32_02880 [Firmicutes bacterium]|nr:hypothetical protein [Bacillota bacterium]
MAEIEKNREASTDGLVLDTPAGDLQTERPEDTYIDVYDDQGKKHQLKVIFSVLDKKNSASYIFVEQGPDQVMALATAIDENNNPTQEELQVVDEHSPYFESVVKYLDAYNKGELTHDESEDEDHVADSK